MKKTANIYLLIMMVLLLLFAACQPANEPDSSSTEDDNTTESTSAAPVIAYEDSSTVLSIESFDGYLLEGKLSLSKGHKDVSKLVIFVNGSGPNTYDNRRSAIVYNNPIMAEFKNRGIAFFSYSTRGVTQGEEPPLYVNIDEEAYQTYLPMNQVEDIRHMIAALKEHERLQNCKVYLLGMSEGTIIAPLVAEKYPALVDGLFLWGYFNQNLQDVLIWQNNGGSTMVWYRAQFETDEQDRISKAAYQADPNKVIAAVLQNTPFEDIDVNNDGFIDNADFRILYPDAVGYTLEELLSAINRRDDGWLREHYGGGKIPLTSAWFLQHFNLKSNMEVLPTLDLPIHIFHGTLDQNVEVREVYKIEGKFKELGKSNLQIHVFEGHDHGLNYGHYFQQYKFSDGLQAIFDTVGLMR